MKHTANHRKMRVAALATLAAGVLILASACSSGGAGSASTASGGSFKMTVGTLPFASVAPFHIAQNEGLFKKAGLTVTSVDANSGAAQIAAVMSGHLDVTYTNFVSAFQAAQQGLPIRIFLSNDLGNTGKHLAAGLMVGANSPVRKPADLKGQKIAINALGGTQELTTRIIMDRAGLSSSDYQLVEIPPGNMAAAIDAKQVSAAWMGDPQLTQGIQDSGYRQIAPAFSGALTSVPQSGWVTTAQFAQEHPQQLAAFTKVMEGVLKEEAADPTQAKVKAAIPTYTDITPEVANKLQLNDFDPSNNLKAISKYYDAMIQYKIVAGPVDINKVLLKQ